MVIFLNCVSVQYGVVSYGKNAHLLNLFIIYELNPLSVNQRLSYSLQQTMECLFTSLTPWMSPRPSWNISCLWRVYSLSTMPSKVSSMVWQRTRLFSFYNRTAFHCLCTFSPYLSINFFGCFRKAYIAKLPWQISWCQDCIKFVIMAQSIFWEPRVFLV